MVSRTGHLNMRASQTRDHHNQLSRTQAKIWALPSTSITRSDEKGYKLENGESLELDDG